MNKKLILSTLALCIFSCTMRADRNLERLQAAAGILSAPVAAGITHGFLKRLPVKIQRLPFVGACAAVGITAGALTNNMLIAERQSDHGADRKAQILTATTLSSVGTGILTMAALRKAPNGFPFIRSHQRKITSLMDYTNSKIARRWFREIYHDNIKMLEENRRIFAYFSAGTAGAMTGMALNKNSKQP